MKRYKILVADPISEKGIELLKSESSFDVEVKLGLKAEADFAAAAADASAIIVRSGVKVTAKVIEAAKDLRVVGRAGVGVDNIDIPAASKRGVVVMNTPAGNTISTAEQAFTLMMSLARKTPHAHASMVAGKFDRKSFNGTEVYGKTLTVLGMGRIGAEFAKRAKAFGMRVVAFDPYLSKSRAESLGVVLVDDLDDAVQQADFITMHMPLTPETKHMINAERISKLKNELADAESFARTANLSEERVSEPWACAGVVGGGLVELLLGDIVEDNRKRHRSRACASRKTSEACRPLVGSASSSASLRAASSVQTSVTQTA